MLRTTTRCILTGCRSTTRLDISSILQRNHKGGCCSLRFYNQQQQPDNDNNNSKRQRPVIDRPEERALGISVFKATKGGTNTGYCYGCGADVRKGGDNSGGVHIEVTDTKGGYWAEKNKVLLKSKIKNWSLCTRCRQLKKAQEGQQNMIALAPNAQMTAVFRAEVSKIRKIENAVVVLCIDAINCTGTLIRTIRKYVGGNPILLAITRCDLLPEYIVNQMSNDQLRDYFYNRTKEISPAGIYLCSESPEHMKKYEGIKNLAGDLWQHLNGRDTFVVGSANIGKSTLTDILINGFLNRGERMKQFRDRLSLRRVEKLREARVTKSALPGTTLQNIRVPCFTDHEQALWDTPGLLLDESLRHFPIKDFNRLRAMRPSTVLPVELIIPEKSFAILLYEEGDEQELPLLRLEVRLKKNDPHGREGPVIFLWNSTLRVFKLRVVPIEEARDREKERSVEAHELQLEEMRQRKEQARLAHEETAHLTPEQRKQRKEEKKRLHEERIFLEQKQMGTKQWIEERRKKRHEIYLQKRLKTLARLSETGQLIIDGNVGMDIDIAHLGWFGVLSPRVTMIKTFAPNTGVRVSCHPSLALPEKWGKYDKPKEQMEEQNEVKRKQKPKAAKEDFSFEGVSDGDSLGVDMFDDFDDAFDFNESDSLSDSDGFIGINDFGDEFDEFGFDGKEDREQDREEDDDRTSFRYVRGAKSPFHNDSPDNDDEDKIGTDKDPWAKYSGHNVGWTFLDDVRFSKKPNIQKGWNPIPKGEDVGAVDVEEEKAHL